MKRLVIITEIIAPYRIPGLNVLARQDGIDLHVIFLAETDPTQRQWPIYRREIRFSYEVLPGWMRRFGRHYCLLNWGMGAALQRARPDVILCGGYNYPASWTAMRWARQNRIPFLLWTESTARDFRSQWTQSLKARFVSQCDGFVVPGISSREYLRRFGVRENRVFTAPNAVDTQFFSQRLNTTTTHCRTSGLPQRFFLFVGRLVPEKGILDLVKAYAALAPEVRRRVGLVIAGDGAARRHLVQVASAVTAGSVHVIGFAQRELLAECYARADMLVFPTHTDPWGLVVNEAMTCGLPVICSSAAGCAADLVRDGWNGRVVGAGNVNQLAAAMDELARDEELRCLMGRRSRERAQLYSPEAWAAGVAQAAGLQGALAA